VKKADWDGWMDESRVLSSRVQASGDQAELG
jgi:hypothetical protein